MGESRKPEHMQGKAGAPPSLCTPAERPSQLPACYLLYKYFLNYQRILVSTFCAWLVSRSEGDRDRVESRTEKETKKEGEKEAERERWKESDRVPETKQDRQMGRESRTKVSGPGAE